MQPNRIHDPGHSDLRQHAIPPVKTGQIVCYETRTYLVSPTVKLGLVARRCKLGQIRVSDCPLCFEESSGVWQGQRPAQGRMSLCSPTCRPAQLKGGSRLALCWCCSLALLSRQGRSPPCR